MTINEMASMAKTHWKVANPEIYQLMVKRGELETEAEAAADLTLQEMKTLQMGGMSLEESWEASCELFILTDPEKNYRPDIDDFEKE